MKTSKLNGLLKDNKRKPQRESGFVTTGLSGSAVTYNSASSNWFLILIKMEKISLSDDFMLDGENCSARMQ